MIRFEGLTGCFGDKVAVNNLSFEVPAGAMYGFLGPNGAGKTTTIRMLMGLLQPTSGKAFIQGVDVTENPIAVRARVGYLPDEVFLYDYLTGRQFLEFIADIHGLATSDRDERIDHYLELFQLNSVAGEYTTNYSFGMKKKLALAGIILHNPPVLLLDEPFNGLDPQAVKDFRELLQGFIKQGHTVLFSSHVLEVVEKLVTHVGIIRQGTLQVSATIEELQRSNHGSLEDVFFQHPSDPDEPGAATKTPDK